MVERFASWIMLYHHLLTIIYRINGRNPPTVPMSSACGLPRSSTGVICRLGPKSLVNLLNR